MRVRHQSTPETRSSPAAQEDKERHSRDCDSGSDLDQYGNEMEKNMKEKASSTGGGDDQEEIGEMLQPKVGRETAKRKHERCGSLKWE